MDKRLVEHSLRIFPHPGWIRYDWDKTTLLVETDRNTGVVPDDGRTVTVTVSGRVADRRGNRIAEPYLFSYTAGDELPPGTISGIVEGAQKSRDAPTVTVLAIDAASSAVLTESEASGLGAFLLPHLPVDGERKLIAVAFQDDNEDGEIDYDYEFYGFSDTITLAPERPAADSILIRLVNADTPGSIAGRVILAAPPDSLIVVLRAEADSVETEYADPDSTGAYEFAGVHAGSYSVLLFHASREELLAVGLTGAVAALAERPIRLRPGEERARFDLPEQVEEPQVTQ